VREIRLQDRFAVLGYTSREKICQLAARSAGRLRIADAQNAYLPLTSSVADAAAVFDEVKSLLRPNVTDT